MSMYRKRHMQYFYAPVSSRTTRGRCPCGTGAAAGKDQGKSAVDSVS